MAIAALRAENDGLTQRLADRAAEVKLLADQLAQARHQFEHFQHKAAEQRQTDRQVADARIAALERDLANVRGNLQDHRDALAVLRGEKTHFETKVVELGEKIEEQARHLYEATEALGAAREMASARQLERDMIEQRLKTVEHENVRLDNRNRELLDEMATLKARQEAAASRARTMTPGEKKWPDISGP